MACILICSDDGEELEILSREVSAQGHDVLTATDGVDALDYAIGRAPDLVFLDENLPVFDGCEACRLLRDDPDVPEALPIVMLTENVPNPRRLESAGFTEYFLIQWADVELREFLARHLGPLSDLPL